MNKNKIKELYNEYFKYEWEICENSNEVKSIIKKYQDTGKLSDKYQIEMDEYGNYIVYKQKIEDFTNEELLLRIQIEQAKNIRFIKNILCFFIILTITFLVFYIVFLLCYYGVR